MGSVIQVDRKEWEDFLGKLSELEKKYQLLLHALDTAHSKLQALDTSQKRYEDKSGSSIPTPADQQPTQGTTKDKLALLTQLKTDLQSLRISLPLRRVWNPNAPPSFALCSHCGSKIVRATRFCNRCGADFGRWVCSCGRALSDLAKFCELCGRRVEDMPSPRSG
jgi:hypothetical protein